MLRSTRLRFALVLFVLLPGLLFQGGETLRVCLHDWVDYEDGCCEEVPSLPPGGDCCAEGGKEPEGPALAGGHECGGCCIELGTDGAELSAPAPKAGGHSLCLALPVRNVAARWTAPPVRRLTPRPAPSACVPPERAPTPLRI